MSKHEFYKKIENDQIMVNWLCRQIPNTTAGCRHGFNCMQFFINKIQDNTDRNFTQTI